MGNSCGIVFDVETSAALPVSVDGSVQLPLAGAFATRLASAQVPAPSASERLQVRQRLLNDVLMPVPSLGIAEIVDWLYMEELARTQTLNREWHVVSAAALRKCVAKFCNTIWQLPQEMCEKWDRSLKRLSDHVNKDEIVFHSCRQSLRVSAKIQVKPLTASNLRDGTNHLFSSGFRDEPRPLPQVYAHLWPVLENILKTTLRLKSWSTPTAQTQRGSRKVWNLWHHCSIEVPYVYAPSTLPNGKQCTASEPNATNKRLCIHIEVSDNGVY